MSARGDIVGAAQGGGSCGAVLPAAAVCLPTVTHRSAHCPNNPPPQDHLQHDVVCVAPRLPRRRLALCACSALRGRMGQGRAARRAAHRVPATPRLLRRCHFNSPTLQLVTSTAYIASVPATFAAFWLCGW